MTQETLVKEVELKEPEIEEGGELEILAKKVEEKRIAAERAKTELNAGWTKEKEEKFRRLSDEWEEALGRYNETRNSLHGPQK